MSRKCYASTLGGCSDTMSSEHPWSQSIFEDGAMVEVVGFPRIPSDRPIPLKTLAAKTLCERHNRILGTLDAEIGIVSDGMQQVRAGHSAEVGVDGHKIERWFLKMAAGSSAAKWAAGGYPTEGIVQQIFGAEANRTVVLSIGFGVERDRDYVGRGIEHYRVDGNSNVMLTVVNGLPMFFSNPHMPDPRHIAELFHKGGFYGKRAVLVRRPTDFSMLNSETGLEARFSFRWRDEAV